MNSLLHLVHCLNKRLILQKQCSSSEIYRKPLISGQVLGPGRTVLHPGVKIDLLFASFQRKRPVSRLVWESSPSISSVCQSSSPQRSSSWFCPYTYATRYGPTNVKGRESAQEQATTIATLDISPEQNCHTSLSCGHYLLLLSLHCFFVVFQLYRNTVSKDLMGDWLY